MKFLTHLLCIVVFSLFSWAGAAPLSGTKSVGPTGDYVSLTAAIADVQSQTLGGPLVLELQAAYVSTVETFPLTIPALNSASAVNTVTIRPATGATALSISSADTTAATLDLNGAQFVTLDGRPGGVGGNLGSGGGTASQLTIANTSTSGVALRFINEASGNTILYTTLRSVNTSATSGTIVFSTTTGASGNDNNTIDHCDIGDGATTPRNGIYSLGTASTAAQNNSGDVVSNSNVFNFVAATGVDAAGVRIDAGNSDWNIIGNSFYQTISRVSVAATVRAIYVNSSSGASFLVGDNFIGGSSVGAGGSPWTASGTGAEGLFVGIQLSVGSTTATSVQGNTVANIVWASKSSAFTLPGVWSGIYIDAGAVNVGTVTGNTIGSGSGAGSISITTSGDGGASYGIGSVSNGTVSITGNSMGSITVKGSGNPVMAAVSLFGIEVTDGVNIISNNLVGSLATANSLNAATWALGSPNVQEVTGIYSVNNASSNITGNTVANLNNDSRQDGAIGRVHGIIVFGKGISVTKNLVRNLSSSSSAFAGSVLAPVKGVALSSATSGLTLSQNTVHTLSSSGSLGGVLGIYYSGPASGINTIAQNIVHTLVVPQTGTAGSVTGMYFASNASFTAQNNMVCIGADASGVSTVNGITDVGTASRRFYHNSVYIGGTQTSGGSTQALTLAPNFSALRNNVLVNVRSNISGSGKHYAVFFNTGSFGGSISNTNLFFASGSGGVLGYYLGDRTTLASLQSATRQDANSLKADPLFLNPTGAGSAVNLHVAANSPVVNAGAPVGVSEDFDGETRSLSTPFIGADEFPAPNIGVAQGGALSDGGSVDFGGVMLGGSNLVRTFTVTNPGTADLTSLVVTKDGTNAGDFIVSALSGTSVPVGSGSVTFTVTFAPSASGARSAAIHIASNVSGAKNPFDITLTGSGLTAFEAWAASNTVSNDPNAIGSNGVKNLLNFAFGVNPVSGSSGALVFNGTFGAGGTIAAVGQPITKIEGANVQALFVRRKDFAAVGLTYTVQFTNDLSGWQDSTDTPAVLADDGINQIVSVPFPSGFSTNGFFRVRTSLP